ncbi:hypothetical protein ACIA5D_05875 [Actinoplanes sp. NPDC051513]|uniref:hypothetical protein n=1 Tax=Actinoplanes sp. NPDC051513 TaxID=3363908 RepID=UPI0037B0C171
MTRVFHGPGGRPRLAVPVGAAQVDFEQCSDSTLVDWISRGSVAAFVALFDRTSSATRDELMARLPGAGQVSQVLAASYVEVWWLAGCRHTPEADITSWIIDIARRRAAEASRRTPWRGEHDAWAGPRPSYAELEVATLLRRPVDRFIR